MNGVLTVVVDGRSVRIHGVRVALRGHTSLREDECTFPKLKLALPPGTDANAPMFAGLHSLKFGTHCGEAPDDQLTEIYGRLANHLSPVREAFVYRLLAAVDVPTLLVRRAKITIEDTAAGEDATQKAPLVRDALIIEDSDDAVKRVGGQREIAETAFTNAKAQLTPADTVRLAFAEAMIGNFDWCLKMAPDDRYRCDARIRYGMCWPRIAAPAGALPLIYDFDVAGIVVGRHAWLTDVFPRTFAGSQSEVEVEVIAQLQRARSLFARRELDEARAGLRRAQAAGVRRPHGRASSTRRARRSRASISTAFYTQIESDQLFYRPVVRAPQAQAFATATGQPACGKPLGDSCRHARQRPVAAPAATASR